MQKTTEDRITNQNHDFTTGNVQKKLIKFAIPILLANILMQLYNYVDSVIVGHYLGKEALAAVGASGMFIFMLVSLIIGIGMGTTIIIGQYVGRNDYASAKKAADSLYIALIVSAVVLTVVGIIFNRQVMEMISLPEEIIPQAVAYLDVFLLGLIFMFLLNAIASVLRGVGDSKSPLMFLALAAVLNVVLDLLFVVGFGWGVEGAAWATVISQAIAVVFAFYYMRRKNLTMATNLFHLKFDKKIFLESIRIGIPVGIQQLAVSVGILTILSLVNGYGTDIIAGYIAASKIEAFVAVFPLNISIAMTSFTAQNYGANLIGRVREGVRASVRISIFTSVVVAVLLTALSSPLMGMFTSEPEVIDVGVNYLHVLGLSYFLFCFLFCYMGALRGMGKTMTTMFITICSLWLIRVPMAMILSNTGLEEMGIWISAPLSWAMGAVFAYVLYRKEYRKMEASKYLREDT